MDRYVRGKGGERVGSISSETSPIKGFETPTSPYQDVTTPTKDHSLNEFHIPSRTSSTRGRESKKRRQSLQPCSSPAPTTPDSRKRSSADSVISYETKASSIPSNHTPLQSKLHAEDSDRLQPLLEDDPKSFDLVEQTSVPSEDSSLERRSEQLFSKEHLESIVSDPQDLLRFTSFLHRRRPQSIPVLIYYLDALKALRAIKYANAVAEALEPITGHPFTECQARPTQNAVLEEKARQAFEVLVNEDLPAYVVHVFIQVASVRVQRRITGTLPSHLLDASEGLGEVFCLTDPTRAENPIVFASEEFHRMTQYGVSHAMARNCRFLQGPRTSPDSTRRIREAIANGKEHSELFLNYHRDGSPFMNLLMVAPLLDNKGKLRYYLGAQVDVSGLVKECTELEAFQRMLEKQEAKTGTNTGEEPERPDEFRELCEMFNMAELDSVKKVGGRMHRERFGNAHDHDHDATSIIHHRLRPHTPSPPPPSPPLSSVYKHYLLLRPHPSLRILFTSPSLRVPGLLQSPFLNHISGAPRVRAELAAAMAAGRGVTAKIRWVTGRREGRTDEGKMRGEEGRPRWIHCTPLCGAGGGVGVWVVVLVDEEGGGGRKGWGREAPPVMGGDVKMMRGGGGVHGGEGDSLVLESAGRTAESVAESEGRSVSVSGESGSGGPGSPYSRSTTGLSYRPGTPQTFLSGFSGAPSFSL
ncbi:hypothetical protein P152DRAFT_390595 [Eremomyces bilateralis CBS 781.70]|uniref:PAC domain-containing protein n=1 Tax=Eremomyces bilateralis CBS 781.70 TaxID=1392243 RepID=A0A6G1GBW5_9PEZI|nr:uncharacterized protein P152DRAFT_390595 [Eremomyces bilateralis CBS 781.70]KAF1815514.1 hypothetical protein P152DRAFT_390595 [Eremomyces bilateralis CBS 781.70]